MAKPPRKNNRNRGPRQPKEFQEEVIQVDRVTRVTKGGRQIRFRATVVIGDHKGKVGYGIGKANEVQAAIQKAVKKAQDRLISIPTYNGTLPHSIKVKYKAAVVFLKPAGEGTGVIAGGAVRKVLDLAGVKNVLSKSLGSNNRLNTTKAAYKALSMMRERPDKESDQSKGKKESEVKGTDLPETKKMSRKEAESKVDADKKVKKSPAKKAATAKKAAPKKKAAETEKK